MQHLDRQQRLYIDPEREGAIDYGGQPGVVAVATKDYRPFWSWEVHDVLHRHHGRADSLEAADHAIRDKLMEIGGIREASAGALTERQRDQAAFDYERQNYRGDDAALADLYRTYNRRVDDNAMRAVSHPSYISSGTKARDEGDLAGLRVRIEQRKAELVAREAA